MEARPPRDMKNLSKWVSYILRHEPHSIGLVIDEGGWASISDLIVKSAAAGKTFTREQILETIRTSDKQRFTLSPDGLRVRAAQGHSIAIDLKLESKKPPMVLWHGTATRFLPSIREQGLLPMGRTHVHLSLDKEIALKVGARHGSPVALHVNAWEMFEGGAEFFRADNGVWLVGEVAPQYLSEVGLPFGIKRLPSMPPKGLALLEYGIDRHKDLAALDDYLSQGLNDALYGRISDGSRKLLSIYDPACDIASALNQKPRTRKIYVTAHTASGIEEVVMDTLADCNPEPVIHELADAFWDLAENPDLGISIPGYAECLRAFVRFSDANAALFYVFTDSSVTITSYVDEHYSLNGIFDTLGWNNAAD